MKWSAENIITEGEGELARRLLARSMASATARKAASLAEEF
jgi:hypothetical protein